MNPSASRIAIFLFSHSPEQEARAKRFSYRLDRKGNEAIAQVLIEHSTRQARKAGMDFFLISSQDQQGESFGERFAQAYQQIFDLGYEQVLSIGNDCPQLDAQLLQRAASHFHRSTSVIGPARDGGIYLLGLHKSQFHRPDFAKLPWQSSLLGESLQAYLQKQGQAMYLLPTLEDIDDAQALNRLLDQAQLKALQSRLKSILNQRITRSVHSHALPSLQAKIRRYSLRAPPPFM